MDHALAIAQWYKSSLTVLHVFSAAPVAAYAPGSPVFPPVVLTPVDREQLVTAMRRFIDAEAAAGVQVDIALREGDTTAEILGAAEAIHADVLVIGTHGRSTFERLVLGSVTERVLRKAACPVLSVPPGVPDAVPAAPMLFKRILCPVDFSDCSLAALGYARSLAQRAGARLTVVHVMAYDMNEAPEMYETIFSDRRLTLAEFHRRWEDACRERLAAAIGDDLPASCRADTMILTGRPYRAILRAAAEQEADLIVIGVRGRGPADLMFIGSTTQHVLREATCPVLTLRQP